MNLKEFCDTNGYILKDRIDYNWDRYGNGIVSVTSILKLIVDPKFEIVMNMYGDKVIEAANKGTLVHGIAESYFNGDLIPTDEDTGIKLNPNISKFHSLFVKQIIRTESRYEKDGVSGTIDLEALVNIRGNIYEANNDYKNSKVKSEKYKLQLGGYEWLNGKPGVLVYLGSKLELVQVESFYKDIFIELKDLFFKLLNNE